MKKYIDKHKIVSNTSLDMSYRRKFYYEKHTRLASRHSRVNCCSRHQNPRGALVLFLAALFQIQLTAMHLGQQQQITQMFGPPPPT